MHAEYHVIPVANMSWWEENINVDCAPPDSLSCVSLGEQTKWLKLGSPPGSFCFIDDAELNLVEDASKSSTSNAICKSLVENRPEKVLKRVIQKNDSCLP